MVLLTETSNIMDASWTLGNIITISSLVGAVVAFIVKIKVDKVKLDSELKAVKEKLTTEVTAANLLIIKQEETIMNNKRGKYAMKKELEELIREKEQSLHARIDRVRDDGIKSYEKLEGKILDLDKKYDINTTKLLEAIALNKNNG